MKLPAQYVEIAKADDILNEHNKQTLIDLLTILYRIYARPSVLDDEGCWF